ncbi:MAG: FAD:protein FMN transferase [Clostridia bacterium]
MNTKIIKKCALVVIALTICIVSLTACNTAKQFFVYGTDLEVKVEGSGGNKLISAVEGYISSLEPILSPTVSGSDLNKINASAENVSVKCQPVTMEIMRFAEQIYLASDGAFDPSIYPLVKLWSFDSKGFSFQGMTPPPQAEIEETLAVVGLNRAFTIDYSASTITKKAGYSKAMLDFGGVAKGYAVDKSLELANEKQKLLVNLGGNIGGTNKDYVIGIRNPRKSDTAYFGSFALHKNECISTSGDYERYYQYKLSAGESAEKTVIYHHILNPKTGYPSGINPASGWQYDDENNDILVSASVITDNGAVGDALSTAVMVLGKVKGIELLNSIGAKAVLIDKNLQHTVVGDVGFTLKK